MTIPQRRQVRLDRHQFSLSAVLSGATAVLDFMGTSLVSSIKDHLAGHSGSWSVVRVSTNNQEYGTYPWARADATQLLFLDTGQLCNRAMSVVLWDLLCRSQQNLKSDFQPTEKISKL